jgi:hypothetical protein
MKTLKKKHPPAIRWFHWINFPLLFLMIWSGLLIYWSNPVYRIGLGSYTLLSFFPERFFQALGIPYHLAKGMSLHFFFMWFFVINGVLYVALHVHFRRVALSGAEPPFIPGSDSRRASRFASEQDRAPAAKIQRRAADCLHNRDPDGRRIACHRNRHLQAGSVRLADGAARRLSMGPLGALLAGRRLRDLFRHSFSAGCKGGLEQLPRHGHRL